jgi:hypothetical protein
VPFVLDTLSATQEAIPEDIQVITVVDREADINSLYTNDKSSFLLPLGLWESHSGSPLSHHQQ